ncbi:MAG: DUF924 family protein [Alphaproteobacteria bacterium]|nr:DUF924 family protein [Alphaproteobacteria bacterium]
MDEQISAVLDFWFDGVVEGEMRPEWWEQSDEFDAQISGQFGETHTCAVAGESDHWPETVEGALAFVIVLDQFSQNLNRGSAAAFAKYPKTLSIAETAIEKGWDQQFPEPNKVFFYLPHEHSEDIKVQRRCFDLFVKTKMGTEYAEAHMKLIERFGRFPHRNKVLGRANTPIPRTAPRRV